MLQSGIDQSKVKKALKGLPFAPGMRDLIEAAHLAGLECIILSDNLNFFIETFLDHAGIR